MGRGAVWDLKINKNERKKDNSLIPPFLKKKCVVNRNKKRNETKKNVYETLKFLFLSKKIALISSYTFHRKDIRNTRVLTRDKTVKSVLSIFCEGEPRLKKN